MSLKRPYFQVLTLNFHFRKIYRFGVISQLIDDFYISAATWRHWMLEKSVRIEWNCSEDQNENWEFWRQKWEGAEKRSEGQNRKENGRKNRNNPKNYKFNWTHGRWSLLSFFLSHKIWIKSKSWRKMLTQYFFTHIKFSKRCTASSNVTKCINSRIKHASTPHTHTKLRETNIFTPNQQWKLNDHTACVCLLYSSDICRLMPVAPDNHTMPCM